MILPQRRGSNGSNGRNLRKGGILNSSHSPIPTFLKFLLFLVVLGPPSPLRAAEQLPATITIQQPNGPPLTYKLTVEVTLELEDAPTPPEQKLRDLVDEAEAKLLAEFYTRLAGTVEKIPGLSVEQFYALHDGGLAELALAENEPLSEALDARAVAAADDMETLADSLREIAQEFSVPRPPTPVPPQPDPPKPDPPQPVPPDPDPVPPPPPESGPRDIVILHETEEDTPECAALWVQLRKENGTAATYIRKHGHRFGILDDDLEYPSVKRLVGKQELPALFILDQKSGEILFQQTLAPDTTADNIIERLRETGG